MIKLPIRAGRIGLPFHSDRQQDEILWDGAYYY